MAETSYPEDLFQCRLVENSIPFRATFTGLATLSRRTWLKCGNICSAAKSDKKIINKQIKIKIHRSHWQADKLFQRRNGERTATCTAVPDSAWLKPDFSVFADSVPLAMPGCRLLRNLSGSVYSIIHRPLNHFTSTTKLIFPSFDVSNQHIAV